MTKKECIEKIVARLNEAGLTLTDNEDLLSEKKVPFSSKSKEIAQLRWLPLINLEGMADMIYSKYNSYQQIYQEWGNRGLLKFEPYIVPSRDDCDDNPSMCLRHNRFIHMFRGYYFQVSGTVDGTGSFARNPYSVQGLMSFIRGEHGSLDSSDLIYMLMYASLIDCGFQIDSFADLFYKEDGKGVELIDRYLIKSMDYWLIKFKGRSFSDIKKYMSYEDGMLLPEDYPNQAVYQIPGNNNNNIWRRFTISEDEIRVEYPTGLDKSVFPSKIVILKVPDLKVGFQQPKGWEEEDDECLYYSFKRCFYKEKDYMKILLLMLLKLSGLHVDFMGAYPIRRLGLISNIPSNKYVTFKSCSDFIKEDNAASHFSDAASAMAGE